MNLLRKVSATFEMIKVLLLDIQSAFAVLDNSERIVNMGFRTV